MVFPKQVRNCRHIGVKDLSVPSANKTVDSKLGSTSASAHPQHTELCIRGGNVLTRSRTASKATLSLCYTMTHTTAYGLGDFELITVM